MINGAENTERTQGKRHIRRRARKAKEVFSEFPQKATPLTNQIELNLTPIDLRAEFNKAVIAQGLSGAKEEKSTSDKWDLVGHAHSLTAEAYNYKRRVYRDASNKIQAILQNAMSHSCVGTMAVLSIGMSLVNLKEHVRILESPKEERVYGDRREKIRILKAYNITEYIFDNHPDYKEILLNTLKSRIKWTENLMRDTAKEFGVEIPLQGQFTVFDENETIDEKSVKYFK